jgi:hypothetical protein
VVLPLFFSVDGEELDLLESEEVEELDVLELSEEELSLFLLSEVSRARLRVP